MYDMAHVAIESMRTAMMKPKVSPSAEEARSAGKSQKRPKSTSTSQKYTIDRAGVMLADRRHAGRSDAYAMNGGPHIKYAYTIALRDTGTHGFLLPPSNIGAVGREAFELVRGMVDYM